MEFNKENKEEIIKRLVDLEKKVEMIDEKLNSGIKKNNSYGKKYEINLSTGNRSFLKVLSIVILTFFIIYWIFRIL
tara:strand:+ start:14 stop:241 length:228 start_codon:yes stop_codon:yes gene_type:complete